MGLIIIGVASVVAFIGVGFIFHKAVMFDDDDLLKTMVVSATIGATIASISISITIISLFAASASGINGMRAFQEVNAAVYEDAIEAIKNDIEPSEGRFFDAARLRQIDAYRSVVEGKRDAVVRYNDKLRSQRYWEGSFLVGWFWKNAADSLNYIGGEATR